MILFNSLYRLFLRLDRAAAEHLTQQQLRRLDPHLLRDIGFKHEGGRVVPLAGRVPEPAAVEVPASAPAQTAAPLSDPQGSGG